MRARALDPLSALRCRCSADGVPISLLPGPADANPPRVTSDLVSLYSFTEGVGVDVDDHAPQGEPDPLIATGKLVARGIGQNGIDLQGGRVGTPQLPGAPASSLPVIAALRRPGRAPSRCGSIRPPDRARRETIASSPWVVQHSTGDDDLEIRLRHTGKSSVGSPGLPRTTPRWGRADPSGPHLRWQHRAAVHRRCRASHHRRPPPARMRTGSAGPDRARNQSRGHLQQSLRRRGAAASGLRRSTTGRSRRRK